MITDKDIDKLKKVFATKDDLKIFATKDDLKNLVTKSDLKNEWQKFATKDDIKGIHQELKRFVSKDDLKKEISELKKSMNISFDQVYSRMIEDLGNIMKDIREIKAEFRGQRIQIGDHEDRLQKVEHKVFL